MQNIVEAVETLSRALANVDPACVCGRQVVELVENAKPIERLAATREAFVAGCILRPGPPTWPKPRPSAPSTESDLLQHHWVDDEGMVAGRFRLPPEVGAALVNRIDAHTDREYRRAWQQGGRESRAAYAADALVTLLWAGDGAGPSPIRSDLVVDVDRDALRLGRGRPLPDPRSGPPASGRCPALRLRRLPQRRAGRWV